MIGYYVHHHGRGHLERATSIAAALSVPVEALSSLPGRGAPFARWHQVPADDRDAEAREHTAGGALHWAPVDAPGYSARMHAIAAWLAAARPELMVVDVSVEVAVLCRLLGVPVVVVAGAGDRNDPAHELAYRLATRIIAPWTRAVYEPQHLRRHRDKTFYVGAFSRFDRAGPIESRTAAPGAGRVVVLFGTGGTHVSAADVTAAAAATPEYCWTAYGLDGSPWCTDVWAALANADVVVTHAGQNALAEVAAARRAAVVIPQERPFGEQYATAQALSAMGIATVRPAWPDPADWPDVLKSVASLGGAAWARWSPGDGAEQAARAIEDAVAHA